MRRLARARRALSSVARRRLDVELVEQGFFAAQADAAAAVLEGRVSTSDRRLEHPGDQVKQGIPLHVRGALPFVSRGGLKLEHGLSHFGVDPTGLACLDVGCSTGGFTDCLLQHGAATVLSVDVGRAEFSWALRHDPRVELLEQTNMCDVPTPARAGTIDLAVCDVSFTSVTRILPAVLELLRPTGSFLTLVKPQFEAPREDVGAGGIVRDESVRQAAIKRVWTAFEEAELSVAGVCESPITGRKGNVEYLLYGCRGR